MECEQCNIIYADAGVGEVTIEQIHRIAENLAKIGVCVVLLIGGEPFVRRDLPAIVKAFTKNGIHVRLQTNGHANRESLEECVRNGAYDISVSLDSLQPEIQDLINGGFERSWERTIKTVAMINDIFPENGSAFFGSVLMERNLDDIVDVIEFATRIGWGVSLVPVHTSSPDTPLGFRSFDDSSVVRPKQNQFLKVAKLLEEVKSLRRKGLNVYDSDEYLDDVYRFISGQPLKWRRRNSDICDSPNLYFALAPNGNLKVCCDYELNTPYPAYHPDFPKWYADGRIHQEVYAFTRRCKGCMYGSYPEITITARYVRPMLARYAYFNLALPKLVRLTADEMKEISAEIVSKRCLERPNDPTYR